MPEAFVYCWTDFLTNKLYVGVHKGSPDDGYVCSSKLMLEEHTKRPNDFSRQIIAEGLFVDMYSLETAILKSVKADKDPRFYNQHVNNGLFSMEGRRHSEITKTKMRERIRTPEHCAKISAAKNSQEQREISRRNGLRNKGRTHTEEFKISHSLLFSGKNNLRFGVPHTKETCEALSKHRKGKSYIVRGKVWEIVSFAGTTIKTQNIAEFCRINNLKRSGMSWAYHKNKSYKGFRVTRREL